MAKMRLTYGEVLAIVNAGMLEVSARTLPTRERYNVFDLKQQLREALRKREEREKELIKECGIEDAAAFDARNEELRGKAKDGSLSAEERKELDGNRAKLETYFAQRTELDKDSAEADLIPDWAEAILFGKFWTAPEDGKPAEKKPETAEEV